VYDITSRILSTPLEPSIFSIYNDFSPNGKVQSILGVTIDDYKASTGSYEDAIQVYVASAEDAQAYPVDGGVYKITNSDIPIKREISVRNDGAVLFSARGDLSASSEDDKGTQVLAGDWSIYFVAVGEEPVFVAKGFQPKWIDDSSFMYVGLYGLYRYNIDTEETTHFFKTQNLVSSSLKMDLSDDSRVIVVSDPADGEVSVLRISDWSAVSDWDIVDEEEAAIIEVGRIPVSAFWVAISPDSSSVALQAFDRGDFSTNARIEFYSLTTLKKMYEGYSLKQFDQKRMFLTDWRK